MDKVLLKTANALPSKDTVEYTIEEGGNNNVFFRATIGGVEFPFRFNLSEEDTDNDLKSAVISMLSNSIAYRTMTSIVFEINTVAKTSGRDFHINDMPDLVDGHSETSYTFTSGNKTIHVWFTDEFFMAYAKGIVLDYFYHNNDDESLNEAEGFTPNEVGWNDNTFASDFLINARGGATWLNEMMADSHYFKLPYSGYWVEVSR